MGTKERFKRAIGGQRTSRRAARGNRERSAEGRRPSEERPDLVAQLANDVLVQMVRHSGFRAHEEERGLIARAIHDDPIQAVVAVSMRLDLLAQRIEDSSIRKEVESLRDDVAYAVERLRNLIFELEPPSLDDEGLAAALNDYLRETAHADGLEFTLNDHTAGEPTDATRVLIYRSAQEAIMNVRKHARASRVDVSLGGQDGQFILKVRDDGCGFDPEQGMQPRAGHLGLRSVRERVRLAGGSMTVDSREGAGTVIEIRVPEATVAG